MSAERKDSSRSSATANRQGYILALISSAAAGVATVVGKWNLEAISPFLMICLIFSVAAVLVIAGILPAKGWRSLLRQSAKGWLWIGLFAGSSWGALWAFWSGVQRMDPSLAAFLNRTEVFVAILLALFFLKERFNRWEILGALLSIVGIVVMRLTLRMEYSSGFWLVLIGSIFFGMVEFTSKIAIRYVEPAILIALRSTLLAVTFWIAFGVQGGSFAGLERVWPGVLALALLGPVAARIFYLWALERIELSKVAVLSQTQPLFVIIFALLALGQLPTLRESLGGFLITVGCIVMIVARPRAVVA